MKECDESTVPGVAVRRSQDLETDVAASVNNRSDSSTADVSAPANRLDHPTTYAAAPAPYPSDTAKADTSVVPDNPSMISNDRPESVEEDAREASQDASETIKYILVFGSTGAGKSTLINHIAGFDRPVSSDALGMTHSVEEGLVKHAGVKYCIIDTSGLNQDYRGLVPGETAETELKNLLRRTADHGLNLMIMVTRGRIAETLDNNYDLFVNTMTSNEVPLVIVQTHLDDEDDLSQWAVDNEKYFKDGGHNAKQIVGAAFPKFNPRRESNDSWSKKTVQESTDRVWKAIEEHSSPTPKIFCERGAIEKLLREIWKMFKRHVVKPVNKKIVSRVVEDNNNMDVANGTPSNRPRYAQLFGDFKTFWMSPGGI